MCKVYVSRAFHYEQESTALGFNTVQTTDTSLVHVINLTCILSIPFNNM
jgi:hypothetical protein